MSLSNWGSKPRANMDVCPKSHFWRKCRIGFRRLRMAVWLTLLAVVLCLAYLNQVGLPRFVKEPLLERLRAGGIDLQFSRLRLRWFRGIVADNVYFGQAEEPLSPRLSFAEVQVRLNYKALAKLRLQVDSLAVRQGRLLLPIAGTNQAPRQLSVENIQTELRLLPNDEWALAHFRAELRGARIQLSGTVVHASAVRKWKFFQPSGPSGVWQDRLRQFADTLDHIHFYSPPELDLDVRGDARDLQSFSARMRLNTPGVDTPWGSVTKGQVTARLTPTTNSATWEAELNLHAAEAKTRWASTTHLQLAIHLRSAEEHPDLASGNLTIAGKQVETGWGDAANADFAAHWTQSLTNPIPLEAEGQLICDQIDSPWGNVRTIELNARMVPPTTNGQQHTKALRGWWANIEPFCLDWKWRLKGFCSAGFGAEEIDGRGCWRMPELTIANLRAKLNPGELSLNACVNVDTRAFELALASSGDPGQISTFLPKDVGRRLAECSWQKPPEIRAKVSLTLPAWTNREPGWLAEAMPSLCVRGEINIAEGAAYRELKVSAAHSHVIYSNMVLDLPDLTVTRPEGGIEAKHESNNRTGGYIWHIHSTVDVKILRSILEKNQQRALDLVTFTQPPIIDAEIRGWSGAPERLGIKGRIDLTNFTFRGESASGFQSGVEYTNRVLLFKDAHLQRGTQQLSASSLSADFISEKIYLTNGLSTAEPQVVARAIGPKVGLAIEPYHFSEPPTAHVYGIIPMHGEEAADLHFDIDGGPFHWWKFTVPRIAGHVYWRGERLMLNDVRLDFYGGKATGSAAIDFDPEDGTDYQFAVVVTNTLLKKLMSDISTGTNHLEGLLNGSLVITKANADLWQSIRGYGNVDLQDGLIWEVPIFGIFSPVLDGVVPGLGSNRASAGTGTFIITNGVIHSDDLEIRSTALRLQYRGTVDLQGHVNARVEAGLLRDMWLVGPLVSTVFWPMTKMFEYKVTGTLSQPKTDPLYFIPKIMLVPFHPLRTLKELLPEDSGGNRTNAPPIASPKSGSP